MAGGLAALFDDVAAIAKLAAASVDDIGAAAGRASAKAAAVVVDDAAVTPKYIQGFTPQRELPVIWKIAKGSLVNKLIITVLAMLLSQFVPWLLTPLLMLGGFYLSFEGAEKISEWIFGSHHAEEPVAAQGPEREKTMIAGAIRTDFILSSEIMVISLKEVATEAFITRLGVLLIVAVAITALVYGAVGLIVKLDDIGLALARRQERASQRIGQLMVKAMPAILRTLTIVGTFAMLWVGGHILLVGLSELNLLSAPYHWVHEMSHALEGISVVGGLLAWLVDTFFSMLTGLVLGTLVLLALLPFHRRKNSPAADHPTDETPEPATEATEQND